MRLKYEKPKYEESLILEILSKNEVLKNLLNPLYYIKKDLNKRVKCNLSIDEKGKVLIYYYNEYEKTLKSFNDLTSSKFNLGKELSISDKKYILCGCVKDNVNQLKDYLSKYKSYKATIEARNFYTIVNNFTDLVLKVEFYN